MFHFIVHKSLINDINPIHSLTLGILIFLFVLGKLDVNVTDSKGQTPLFITAKLGYTDSAKILLDAGSDCNVRCAGCQTPVIAAAMEDHLNVVKVLLRVKKALTEFLLECFLSPAFCTKKRWPLKCVCQYVCPSVCPS